MSGPITITDGGYTEKDSDEALSYTFDFDTLNLAPGVQLISAGTFVITPNDGVLLQDNPELLVGNRKTKVRLRAGTIGVKYEIANRVQTNESPAQIKEKRFYLRIKS